MLRGACFFHFFAFSPKNCSKLITCSRQWLSLARWQRNVLLLLYRNGTRSCDDTTKSGSRKDHKEAENKMWKTCEPEHIIHRFVLVDNGNGTSDDDDANFILLSQSVLFCSRICISTHLPHFPVSVTALNCTVSGAASKGSAQWRRRVAFRSNPIRP